MTETPLDEPERLIRQYAAGEMTWSQLRERGFESYRDVLSYLKRLGLRPPMAPMAGPNVDARMRGRALLRQSLELARP